METRDKKIKEINEKLESYNKKIKFSIVSLIFFIFMFITYIINPVFGSVVTYIFGIITVVFAQQTIQSYNYIKFYKMSYNAHVILYDKFKK
jgi:hypothetical protein